MASPIILILGSGPNIGQHVARIFAAKGYKVVLASRRLKEEDSTADQVNISTDLSNPDSVISVFSKVKSLLGFPSVVIYNGKISSNISIQVFIKTLLTLLLKLVQELQTMQRIHSLSPWLILLKTSTSTQPVPSLLPRKLY
jgi:NAD(P)-dependent dehydrogenase (short-subunit alcohol dehydrogenase family)